MEKILEGIAASGGIAEGKARVVLDPENAGDFEFGNILVTPKTTPEYTSILLKAAAIITDTGGMLCHASIIARELGVPCVVGTKNATTTVKDKDQIKVDGDKGVIYRSKT
ncbi:MAG: hypothetical protein GOV15_02325 [Candidatus Diapherotrites archaeon]|nr:hypothetical protein [Candidatus Diapherotrites archaeon]